MKKAKTEEIKNLGKKKKELTKIIGREQNLKICFIPMRRDL